MTQTAFMYIRVSTPAQQVAEQVRTNRQYAGRKGIARHEAERWLLPNVGYDPG